MKRQNLYIFFVIQIFICSCTVTKPVKTGEMAFEYKQFVLATELLENEFEATSNDQVKARKSMLLAKAFDMIEEYGEALQWYDIADQYYNSDKSSIDLAYSLKRNERYKDAEQRFQEIYQHTKEIKYLKEVKICSTAWMQKKNVDNVRIESLAFNSYYSEYSPCYFEEDFILFSSDRESSTGNKVYKWNDSNFSDIFVSDREGRQEYNFDALINTEHNEGTVCFSKNFEEIFFTRCFSSEERDQHCKIYYSQRPNGFWLEPEALMFFDDKTNFGHPCLIENDSVLIFTAKAGGSDNYDLYYSVKIGNGWSEADIMPSNINTEGDEKFPKAYGDTLYFASDGHIGYGGLDIFKSILLDDGSWSQPVNMGWPINGGADDFDLVIEPNFSKNNNIALKGLFSSSRNTGNRSDIFSFIQFAEKPEIPDEEVVEEIMETQSFDVYISGLVVENIRENGDPNAKIIEAIKLNEGRVDISYEDTIAFEKLNENGRFLYKAKSEQNHTIVVKTKDHLHKQIIVTIPPFSSLKSDTTINLRFVMERIVYDTEIIISNIYYDFNKWDIREDAEAPLDSLSEMLKLNAQLKIELGSHTDCRGEDQYNLNLSQKRAQSVMNYLNNKGVGEDRLKAIGYGETKFAIDCECNSCTEEEHQANRRTTFKILKPE